MKRRWFAIIAIFIFISLSFSPIINANTQTNIEKEVTIEIHTLNGIKTIRKELPIKELKGLTLLINETKNNGNVDGLLLALNKYGLLGDLSIKEVKELVTGEYLQKEKNSSEIKNIAMMTQLFSQNGWKVNGFCLYSVWGRIFDFHPWNIISYPLFGFLDFLFSIIDPHQYYYLSLTILLLMASIELFYMLLEGIPHPTTLGLWIIKPAGIHDASADLYTLGLLGEKQISTKKTIIAFTLGFTGLIIIGRVGIGFSLFTAFKQI